MTFIRTFFIALLMLISNSISAEGYVFLSVVHTDGQTNISISTIRKITFSGDYMVFTMTDQTEQKLPLNKLSRMFFSVDGTVGITATETDKPAFQLKDGILSVKGREGDRISIIDINGRIIRHAIVNTNSTDIDLDGISKGVYIIRLGNETSKFMNK